MKLATDQERRAHAVLRARLLRAVWAATRRVARVAKGKRPFASDHHARACIALSRLAPAMLEAVEEDPLLQASYELTEDQIQALDLLDRLSMQKKLEGAKS